MRSRVRPWANGSHLQQFGPVLGVVPPWIQLILDEAQIRGVFESQTWPADAPVSPTKVLDWIYHSEYLNRLIVRKLKSIFKSPEFETVWLCDLVNPVDERFRMLAHYISTLIPLTSAELLCRGCSMLLTRPEAAT